MVTPVAGVAGQFLDFFLGRASVVALPRTIELPLGSVLRIIAIAADGGPPPERVTLHFGEALPDRDAAGGPGSPPMVIEGSASPRRSGGTAMTTIRNGIDSSQRNGMSSRTASASGHAMDARAHPGFAPYDMMKPKVCSHRDGDVAARIVVRFEETFESLRM